MAILDKIEPGLPAELLQRRAPTFEGLLRCNVEQCTNRVAVAERLPQLTIRGDITVEARNVNVLYSSNSIAHNVGPGFRWNILNFKRLKRNIEIREALYQQSLYRYEAAVLRAVKEVESALVEYTRQRERVRELQKVTEATARSVEISLIRYEQNLITFDRVLDSQRSLA